jgi:hypothetical protein
MKRCLLSAGYVRDVTVSGSEFSWLGGNGVLAVGDDDWVGGLRKPSLFPFHFLNTW